ncbi:MAG: T9SS type A sorting domain-containing protein [Bacteroidales bacterium]|nr:T9SS type A sorting domain-containing protein [Bacteroidales bacterium]
MGLSFVVTCDTSFIAYFTEVTGIDGVGVKGLRVYAENHKLVIEDSEGVAVNVYDVMGNLVCSKPAEKRGTTALEVPSAGVYMVKVGDFPARKVVVVK